MIRPEQIPDEVAATIEWMISRGENWKSAIAAALSAWPDRMMYGPHSSGHGPSRHQLVLPLPKETSE